MGTNWTSNLQLVEVEKYQLTQRPSVYQLPLGSISDDWANAESARPNAYIPNSEGLKSLHIQSKNIQSKGLNYIISSHDDNLKKDSLRYKIIYCFPTVTIQISYKTLIFLLKNLTLIL